MNHKSAINWTVIRGGEAQMRALVEGQCAEWPSWPDLFHAGGLAAEAIVPDFSQLLWNDAELLRTPGEKTIRVIEALADVLARRRPLAGAEQACVEMFERLAATQTEHFAEVMQSPQAFLWTRVAVELVGQRLLARPISATAGEYVKVLGLTNPQAALQHHLNQFQSFALAVACRAGAEWTPERPLVVRLPWALPAARWSIDGEGTIAIEGWSRGRLTVNRAGRSLELALNPQSQPDASTGLMLCKCPVATLADYELPLQPHAFNFPGLEVAEPALRAGHEYQEQHVALLDETLSLLQRHAPSVFEHFRRAMRLAALKPRAWGKYDDFSHPEMPGTFLASVIANPLEMADHLIHEFQHNRLSLVEESGPLFDSAWGDAENDERFFSPWRDKLRNLHGTFQGLYVCVALTRYWLAVYRSGEAHGDDRAYVVDRLLRLPRQLQLAVGILERNAHLTPLGEGVYRQLSRDVDDVLTEVAATNLPIDAAALTVADDGSYSREISKITGRALSARESVREHVRIHDSLGQCAGLLDDLRPTLAGRA